MINYKIEIIEQEERIKVKTKKIISEIIQKQYASVGYLKTI